MSRARAPGKSSTGARALAALHAMGGMATEQQWQVAAKWAKTANGFVENIITSLVVSGLVYCKGELYAISEDGLEYLDVPLDAPPSVPLPIVAPRYTGSGRPLSKQFIVRPVLTREGALDYRDIPSRVGDRLIAHGSKA